MSAVLELDGGYDAGRAAALSGVSKSTVTTGREEINEFIVDVELIPFRDIDQRLSLLKDRQLPIADVETRFQERSQGGVPVREQVEPSDNQHGLRVYIRENDGGGRSVEQPAGTHRERRPASS